MPNLPEVLQPASGYLALVGLAIIALSLGWVIGLFLKKKAHAPTHAQRPQEPHHPKKDGGDHGGDDHHGSGLHWSVRVLMVIALIIVVIYIILPWLASQNSKHAPGARSETRLELSYNRASATTVSFDMSACAETPENITVVAPPRGAALAAMFPIPMCYTAKLCDKKQDQQCAAQEFDAARFSLRCESVGDNSVTREFNRERDLESQTCWVQSKGPHEVPIEVIYRIKDNL